MYHNITRDVLVMEEEVAVSPQNEVETAEEPQVLEEIVVEELNIDGVCGVY
jgi:mycofactocin precursor